jgi:hypothetical protein
VPIAVISCRVCTALTAMVAAWLIGCWRASARQSPSTANSRPPCSPRLLFPSRAAGARSLPPRRVPYDGAASTRDATLASEAALRDPTRHTPTGHPFFDRSMSLVVQRSLPRENEAGGCCINFSNCETRFNGTRGTIGRQRLIVSTSPLLPAARWSTSAAEAKSPYLRNRQTALQTAPPV